MAWTRLDDQFFANPKVIDLSKDAKLLYLSAVTYSAGQLTDGRIGPGALRTVSALVDADRACAAELVACGLWESDGDDYLIHDYLEYNPTAAEVRAKRAADRARKRPVSNEGSQNNSVGNPRGIQTESFPPNPNTQSQYPEPTPKPEPVRKPKPLAADKPPRERDETWDAVSLLCGEPQTEDERSDFGRTVKQLKAADAKPDEIAAFGPWWFQNHEDARLTHRCFRKHWGAFRNAPQRPPQITDIKSNLVRAIVTADFSENHAEIEAERDRRRAIQEQATRPRQLPVTPRGITAGE